MPEPGQLVLNDIPDHCRVDREVLGERMGFPCVSTFFFAATRRAPEMRPPPRSFAIDVTPYAVTGSVIRAGTLTRSSGPTELRQRRAASTRESCSRLKDRRHFFAKLEELAFLLFAE